MAYITYDVKYMVDPLRGRPRVAFILREEVYRPEGKSLRGQAELILAKQRNGPMGKVAD